jgi:hypothetical protein
MSQPELLRQIVAILESLGIDFMVTGSVVSGIQGEPRTTHDVDLIVALDEKSAQRLFGAFSPSEFFLTEQAIHEALKHGTMFNLLDLTRGDKVDFWILTDEPFDQSRFLRKQTAEVLGIRFPISSPEDTILQKLRWAALSGGSEKHFRDALRVYEVQHGRLDQAYLDDWAERLGVVDNWRRLQSEAEPF